MNFLEKIKRGGHDLWPSCREASRGQSDQFERPLPPVKRFGLWFHLILCKWCRRYGQQVRFLRAAAHEHTETFVATAPEKLSPAARERIKQHLRGKT